MLRTENKTWMAAAFFVLCLVMTLLYLAVGYGAYLDSDMASELTLARHLADTGLPFSGEWYYSTEVRLLNTQLVFAPLMMIPGISWQMVRLFGCAVLLAVLAVTVIYTATALGAEKAYALFFAGLSISLCSPLYAQNVIVGAYYVPHAVLSMLLVGMFSMWRRKGGRANAAFLAVLAFVMGMSSIRYMLSAVLPMFCSVIWMYFFPGDCEAGRTKKHHMSAALAVCVAAAGAAGYLTGKKILPACFHIDLEYYASTTYADWGEHNLFEQIQTIIRGLLEALGFKGGVPLFGMQGILNALILLMVFVSSIVLLEWKPVERQASSPAACEMVRFGRLTLIFAFCISVGAFVLLRGVYFDRYWLPVIMMGAPIMAACLTGIKDRLLRAAILVLFAGTVLLTSVSCAYYSIRNHQVESEMRMEAVKKAEELGIEKGYATFWNANILTELTDGRLDVVSLSKKYNGEGNWGLTPYRWMEAEADFDMDRPDEPVFLLLGTWEDDGLEPFLLKTEAERHEIAGDIQFYVIPSQRHLFDALSDDNAG